MGGKNSTLPDIIRIWFLVGGVYGFLFRSELDLFIFCHAKREFFFQNLTLGCMTETLNQIIFFSPPKSEYFFQQHWESEYFFRKNHNPPFKLNGRFLMMSWINSQHWTISTGRHFQNRRHNTAKFNIVWFQRHLICG